MVLDIRPKDLAKPKVALAKNKKARVTEIAPKKARTKGLGQKDAPIKKALEVAIEVVLVTSVTVSTCSGHLLSLTLAPVLNQCPLTFQWVGFYGGFYHFRGSFGQHLERHDLPRLESHLGAC